MRILLLEDDIDMADFIAAKIEAAEHNCTVVRDGPAALAQLRKASFDVLVLDWEVPQISGLEITRWVRENLNPCPPILMLTGRTMDSDVVTALNQGADDYVTKPMQPAVLLARLAALNRRTNQTWREAGVERFGEFSFHPGSDTVTTPTAQIALTAKEFALALVLFRNFSRPLSRSYLTENVWGYSLETNTRTLDAHISAIRSKLRLRPDNGYRLASVYSFGYRLEPAHDV